MNLKNDTRTWPRGPILDAIAPGLNATERWAAEARLGRWTNEGIILVEGRKHAGMGRHRRYRAAEVALLAVAETLHQHKLQIDAIEDIVFCLRLEITHNPGANPIDLAAYGISGQTVDPQDTLVSLVPTSGQVVGHAELAQHPMSVNICLFHILKPLAGMFASQGARVSRWRKYRLDN